MSEQNILNPVQGSLLGPDWGYAEQTPETRSTFQAQSGKVFTRRQMGAGRVYDLPWNNRDLATKHALQQWEKQYENDFFSVADWERGRYFSGRFAGPLNFSPAGNNRYNIRAQFAELPGLPMFAYPSNWARDAIFIEERNGFGEDLVKLTGTWALSNDLNTHGGNDYTSSNANDTAEWLYFGYGLRLYSAKASNHGIVELTVTRARDGLQVVLPTNIDLFNAATLYNQIVSTQINQSLDWYRVKLRNTGTKNVASTGFLVRADAIEVMQ